MLIVFFRQGEHESSEVLCLFSSLAKITNYVHVYPTFQAFPFWKLGFFRKWGDKPYTKAVKPHLLGQFLKGTTTVHFFFPKTTAVLIESEDKPNRSYILKTFYKKLLSFYGKHCGFLDCFLRTKRTTLMCGWLKLSLKQVKLIWMFPSFKSR